MRDWVALSLSWAVGEGPSVPIIANVRCCRAIVRVMLIWLLESGAGGVGVGMLYSCKVGSMTTVATR